MVRDRVTAGQHTRWQVLPFASTELFGNFFQGSMDVMERVVPVRGSPIELERSREKQEVPRPQDKAKGCPWRCLSSYKVVYNCPSFVKNRLSHKWPVYPRTLCKGFKA